MISYVNTWVFDGFLQFHSSTSKAPKVRGLHVSCPGPGTSPRARGQGGGRHGRGGGGGHAEPSAGRVVGG